MDRGAWQATVHGVTQSRRKDTPVAIRRGEGAQMRWCGEHGCYPRVRPVVGELWGCHHGCQVPFCTFIKCIDWLKKKKKKESMKTE